MQKKIEFHKYHGAGNDFIMLDNRLGCYSGFTQSFISTLCDRHFGIGADGLIMLENSREGDFYMRYYNSDGCESTMCGNGGRCVTLFAHNLGIINHNTIFYAIDGEHHAQILPNLQIRLKMSNCIMPQKIANDMYIIDTGSPHLVIFKTGIDTMDIIPPGRKYRYDQNISTQGVNVNFCEILNNAVTIRTYERGVENETLACGTGSVAAAIVSVVSRKIDHNGPITVITQGGTLKVEFRIYETITDIYLTGEAKKTYSGTI